MSSNGTNGRAKRTRTPIRVGIAGLGRSGWNNHARALERQADRFQIVAVMDICADRRAEAVDRFGCRPHETFDSLVADDEVELLVIATPNHLHAQQSIAALRAGRHVLCEKPMAVSVSEADRMIAAARAAQRTLTVFQNRRYDPHFVQVRRVIDSGVLGRIVQIRMTIHSFARRWDWQTLQEFGGGTLNNIGAHFLDQALELIHAPEPEVFCHLDRALSLGDADDHGLIILRAPGEPLIQLEVTSACGYPQDLWLVMGERGTLRGSVRRLDWKVADFSHLPQPRLERSSAAPGRGYNREEIRWQEHDWTVPADQLSSAYLNERFYHDLYRSLREGAPLTVTPESVRRQAAVRDRCRAASHFAEPPTVTIVPAAVKV